jgi:SAM-dependent methyltransferase
VWTPAALARVRSEEVDAAVEALCPGATVHHVGLPDGGLAERTDDLVRAVAPVVGPGSLVVAPWVADGHPDHDAAGGAARVVADRAGAALVHYPLWLWHWGTPADLPWDAVAVVEPGPAALSAKRHALDLFGSQTAPLGPGAEHAPVVTPPVLGRALRPFEVLLDPGKVLAPRAEPSGSEAAGPFDEMFDEDEDPWRVGSSWYERRKRTLALGVLRRRHHPRVLEIGCSSGVLTAGLDAVAGEVVAMDVSARALEVARRDGPPGVTWLHGSAPGALPSGPFDLVVMSEVGYFLTPLALVRSLAAVRRALAPGGEVLLVDWRHPTTGTPLDGPAVHELAAAALGDLPHSAHYRDADVAIDLWGGMPSLAEREGRT